jgi:hypothetical protein
MFVLITLFEYFFEPFTRNYEEHLYDYWIICVFHAAVATICYLITFLLFHIKSQPTRWRIRDEVAFIFILIFLVGLGAFLIRDLIYDADNWRWYQLRTEMSHGFLAGILFYSIIITINLKLLQAGIILNSESGNQKIFMEAQVSSDSFSVNPTSIICIKADGNYTIFYFTENEQVQEKMIRQTLDKIATQLNPHPNFVRTHRAFIVNRAFVLESSGNAAGLQLSVKGLDFKVPVSRSNIQKYQEQVS